MGGLKDKRGEGGKEGVHESEKLLSNGNLMKRKGRSKNVWKYLLMGKGEEQ